MQVTEEHRAIAKDVMDEIREGSANLHDLPLGDHEVQILMNEVTKEIQKYQLLDLLHTWLAYWARIAREYWKNSGPHGVCFTADEFYDHIGVYSKTFYNIHNALRVFADRDHFGLLWLLENTIDGFYVSVAKNEAFYFQNMRDGTYFVSLQ